jgi:hypothetical protein
MGGDSSRLIDRRHRLIDEKHGGSLGNLVFYWRRPAFVIALDLHQSLNRVGLFVVIDDGVVCSAHQDEVVIAVSLCGGLPRVVSWTARVRSLDMADFPYEHAA